MRRRAWIGIGLLVVIYLALGVLAHVYASHLDRAGTAAPQSFEPAAHIEICYALAQQKGRPKEIPSCEPDENVCRCDIRGCICGDKCPGCKCYDCKCSPLLTYDAALKRAKKQGKPIIVFVGQAIRPFDNCIMLRQEAFDGVTGKAVVIGLPSKDATDKRFDRTDLLGTPTDAQIKDVLSGKDAAKIELTIPKTQAIIECSGGR